MKILNVNNCDPERDLIQACSKLEQICFGEKGAFNPFVIGAAALAGSLFAACDFNGRVTASAVFFQGTPHPSMMKSASQMLSISENQNTTDTVSGIYLASLCVHPEFRNQGIGKLILQNSFNCLVAKGFNFCWMTVSPDNHQALRLYESQGFKITATLENLYGEGEHRHILSRRLT